MPRLGAGGIGSQTFAVGDVEIGKVKLLDAGGSNVASISAAGAIKVDNSAVTQPISAISLPLPTSAATSIKQSDGSQKTQVVDSAGNVVGATANALDVNIKSGNPTTITATQSTGTNLHTVVDSGTVTANISGSINNTSFASTVADGANVTLGAKADAKSTATDTTAISVMSVLKQISASVQAPPSQAVTGTFWQATQPVSVASGQIASGAIASGAIASGAVASGAIVDGAMVTIGAKTDAKSTATDGTSTSVVSILKEISAMAQAPAALPANQSVNVAQINGATPLMGAGNTGTGSPRVTIASDQASIPVAATLGAETTKVIGTVNIASSQTIGAVTTITNPVPTKEQPDATSTYAVTTSDTSAYAASLVVKASAGVVFGITGYNSKSSGQFIQLHNASSLPADTAVPKHIFYVPANSNFSLDMGKFGSYFGTGIVICNSSAGATKVLGSADCWFSVSYI